MKRKLLMLAAAIAVSVASLSAQDPSMAPLPADEAVRVGVLDNGLTYYIRHNEKPAGQAEFYILHDVGAMQEEDSQQGLAHFLEHMAFNGTKNFPDKNITKWLESIGVKFGMDLNAATGQEVTFYRMSNVPLLRESIIDSALLVLHDWSYFIALEGDEIDNERGVIVEELRTRNDASWRIREKSGPYLYGDTKYAKRNVIGFEEGLRTFSHKEIRDFYHRWYRTDLQTIVIVGDFDVDQMEAKVKSVMADIPKVENPEAREVILIPDNEEPIVGVLTDPELSETGVTIYIKREVFPKEINNTITKELFNMVDNLIATIATERLRDIAMKPNAPFVQAYMGSQNVVSTSDMAYFGASCRDNESLEAFRALYTEIEKIQRFGFTEAEFERAKSQLLRSAEQQYDNRNDRRHGDYVWTYLNNFRENTSMMSAETEWEIDQMMLNQVITLDALNQIAQMRITSTNQVILIEAPEKEGAVIPTIEQVNAIIAEVRTSEIEANAEETASEPLIPANTKLKGSKVVKTTTDKFGATEWTLKNGVKVIVKPTDFKADQILMNVTSQGGASVLTDDEVLTADNLASYIQSSGLGKFTASDLRKQLTGKRASIAPSVGPYSNGFSGSASPKDLETLMQLTYLSFTSPRWDEGDFDVMIDRMKAQYSNMAGNPMFILNDSLTNTVFDNSVRRQMLTYDKIDQIDYAKMKPIFDKLYSNADDFTFTFVGNVDMDTLQQLVEKYLGSLPKTKAKYSWKDDGVRVAKGKVDNVFTVRMEQPKSSVVFYMSGSTEYNLENKLAMNFLAESLDMRYMESIREEKGGTYGVSVMGNVGKIPVEQYTLLILFDTDPALADELIEIIHKEIETIAREGLRADDLSKTKEFYAKSHPDAIKQNSYWLNTLTEYHIWGHDMDANYMETVNSFTSDYFKGLASKIISDGNVIKIVMNPAE